MYEIIDISGATFIFFPFQNIETASLGVFLRIGSRFEQRSLKGIAHFLEHMLFKGSRRYCCRRIKQEIEGRGGTLNAFTSQELTAYYAQFLSKNFKTTLNIIMDMVYNPVFAQRDIDRERKVILEEIKMYNDLPAARAVVLLDRLLWEDHPLGEEVIGYAPTVKKVGRADLIRFKQKYYTPFNTVIAFSGSRAKDEIAGFLRKIIKPDNQRVSFKASPPLPCRGLRIKCEKKNLEQVHLCLGFRGVSYLSRQRLVMQLINVILGANMSSRLFDNLREKKSLCYEISTEVRKYRDSGAFVIHTGLDNHKILIATRAIIRELIRIKNKPVGEQELSRAKDYLLGQLAMSLERPAGRMFHFAQDYLTRGKIQPFSDLQREVHAVRPPQIMKLAQAIFDFSNLRISCVGNIGSNCQEQISKVVQYES